MNAIASIRARNQGAAARRKGSMKIVVAALTALIMALVSVPALSEGGHARDGGRNWGSGGDHRDHRDGRSWRGGEHRDGHFRNHGRFRDHDFDRWRGRSGWHDHRDWRFRRGWIGGGGWYLYPRPLYAYPDFYEPPVVVVPSAPLESGYWYYCRDPEGYYPDVTECREGWDRVPAEP
jgi:hypothetical protein